MKQVEFTALASTGSHIAPAYLTALAIIGIMDSGSEPAKALCRRRVSKFFTHPSPESTAEQGNGPSEEVKIHDYLS